MVVTLQVAINFLFFLVSVLASAWAYAQSDAVTSSRPPTMPVVMQRERVHADGEPLFPAGPRTTMAGDHGVAQPIDANLGYALYQSIQHQEWATAQQMLTEYKTLANHDPLLIYHVQGALARGQGDLAQAEVAFRELLALKPDFLPAQLELARILFEDMQEEEAEQIFSDIFVAIDASDPKTAGVRKTIEAYLAALKKRQAWSGSISLGPIWSDNINRTSASQTCLWEGPGGFCFYQRTLPAKISATGVDLDASLQRYFPLYKHHGGYVRTLVSSTYYPRYTDYSEATAIAQAGYSYRDTRQEITLAPSFEYYLWGGDTLYSAWGGHGGWSYIFSPRALMKLEADYKLQRYRQPEYASNFDGSTRSISATYFQGVGTNWTLFGGVDYANTTAQQKMNAYQQVGGRLGASLQSPSGWLGSFFVSYRHRNYAAYNPFVAADRRDNEQVYTFVLKVPRWQIGSLVPSLTLRHHAVNSNVDWLYSYKRSDVSLKLEYAF